MNYGIGISRKEDLLLGVSMIYMGRNSM